MVLSVAWMNLGNELYADHASHKHFHAILEQRLPNLGHLNVQTVHVVDHLGQNLPMPLFWQMGGEHNVAT